MIKMLSLAHISLTRELRALMMNLIICNMIHAVPLCDYLLTIEPQCLYVI